MTTRMDHTNCSHPRTPAGRAACRRSSATPATPSVAPTRAVPGCTDRNGTCMVNLCLCNDSTGAGTRAAKRAVEAMDRVSKKIGKITVVADMPMPKLTPDQQRSPIIRSMMRKV